MPHLNERERDRITLSPLIGRERRGMAFVFHF
jgi:hypothetical protein